MATYANSLTGANVLESSLARVPSAKTAGSAPPSGPAGGDLTGTYPNPGLAPESVGGDELKATSTAQSSVTVADNNSATASVKCPQGTQVVSGGGTTSSFGINMVTSFRSGNGWIVAYQNTTASPGTITAIATCLDQ